MKKIPSYLAFTVPLLLCFFSIAYTESGDIACRPQVSVRFSPKGRATDKVVQEINAAQSEILMQAYNFSSAPIAKALIDASKRSAKITAVLDRSNETAKYTDFSDP